MSSFSGIWVPLVTPFRQGEIDFSALKSLCTRLLKRGVDGVVVCGTTGEAPMLTKEEQLQVLDAVLEIVPGHQVIMGLSGTHMPVIRDMQEAIQRRPVAGLLIPAPYYLRPSQPALVAWFNEIADRATVPVVLYNIPYRTGVHMEIETFRQLAKHPRITAVKDCGGSIDLTLSLIGDGELDVLCGEDVQIFSTLSLGGAGAIAASSHIFPEEFVQLIRQFREQDIVAARKTFFGLLPMIRLMFSAPNPAAIKYALSLDGLMNNELRSPMLPAPENVEVAVRDFLNQHTR
ncbi:4-hydroxy-tetrahydrodipicolinate synthase [Rahnella victoriana]|uniref:4-hydroxy-tetrahydrodipicolinate synthase n=1 Tax=Rahnella victoriana TaxID=1510570 RepID=UPI0010409324|nr:4-hydroxy-tetrahydrodipicolinate synthase [Rahnella victoriana]TBX34914.1 4-hydroxy-tetrahydrodipicolinate synthase [Rahnella victoriana]UHM90674.1 4-hydroxy-tetrahydrodipicolinate synthase [Rahnella victoriana]